MSKASNSESLLKCWFQKILLLCFYEVARDEEGLSGFDEGPYRQLVHERNLVNDILTT